MQNRISLHLNDLLIGICLLALCSTAMVMAINGEREVSRRLKCQLNLRQIASAIQDYQDQNHQAYPRTVAGNADNLTPTWGTPYQTDKAMGPIQGADPFDGKTKAMPAANDVTASLFLLMRTEKITTAAFVCPSSGATPWDFGGGPNTAMNWTNFAGNDGIAKHLSYSFQNFFASRHAIANGFQVTSPDATFAVAADLNPGGAAVVSVTPRSTPEKIHTANSHNHKQDGQNVLYSDGHAEWERSPFSGAEHDNIYTAGGPEIQGADRKTATVVASPVDSNDSVLLPTAADVGINERLPKQVTSAEITAMKRALEGSYSAQISAKPANLTVDDQTITCSAGPMTLVYHYQITGSDGDSMVLKLTAPNTETDAIATPNKSGVNINMHDDFSLDYFWRRVEKKSGAQMR